MDYNLKINDVDKSFKSRKILSNINLEMRAGEIIGFLGPNGAGKSTTIRIMTGLIKPDKGYIKILENDLSKNRTSALKHIGAIVENPVFYADLSAEENLKQCARCFGDIPKNRISEVLELVGLYERRRDKVKTFSLGMKQRLGLGQAILHKPKFLILDEPLNGLDPFGVIEFRKIIKNICHEFNSGILISSHILSEIEEVCNKVIFINHGEIVSTESMDFIKNLSNDYISIVTNEKEKCISTFNQLDYIKEIKFDEGRIYLNIKEGCFEQLKKSILINKLDIDEIYRDKSNLENRFLNIINGGD